MALEKNSQGESQQQMPLRTGAEKRLHRQWVTRRPGMTGAVAPTRLSTPSSVPQAPMLWTPGTGKKRPGGSGGPHPPGGSALEEPFEKPFIHICAPLPEHGWSASWWQALSLALSLPALSGN